MTTQRHNPIASRLLATLLFVAALCIAPRALAAFENMDTDPEPDLRIRFRRVCVVRGKEVRLGDVADIETPDKRRAERLEHLSVGHSPAMGYRQRMHHVQLRAQLRSQGIDETNAVIECPDSIFVEREIQKLDIDALRAEIERQVLDRIAFDPSEAVIEDVNLPREVVMNAGEVSWKIDVRVPRREVGHGSFTAEVCVGGNLERRLSGTLRLDRRVEVYETARAARRDEPIRPECCKAVVRYLSELRGTPLTRDDFAGPLEARRSLKPGEVLTWLNVERRLMVKRGQAVRMVLESDEGMRITTVGQSRDNGSLGDLVEVMNINSGKRIQAVVAGNRVVRVPY